jgi:hypothetical protein
MSDYGGAFDRSMQHHLRTDLFEGGVYDPCETLQSFLEFNAHLNGNHARGAIPAQSDAK